MKVGYLWTPLKPRIGSFYIALGYTSTFGIGGHGAGNGGTERDGLQLETVEG